MATLIFSSIKGIIVDLMKIFVKQEVLENATNVAKVDLNCQEKKKVKKKKKKEEKKVAANIIFQDSFS